MSPLITKQKAISVRVCVFVEVCVLFLDESVDVVLSSMLTVGHLKHTRHTQQGLLSVSVAHNLDAHTERKKKDKKVRG